MNFEEIIITNGISSVIILGFLTWAGKVVLERHKIELNKEIELLKNAYELKSHVGRSQFDKEFSVYQDIWFLLFPAKLSVLNLRPRMDFVDPKESKDERRQKRLQKFYDNLTKLRDLLEVNEPFIDKAVYIKVKNIIEEAHAEALDYQHLEPQDVGFKEYWAKQKENHQNINMLIDEASEAIRYRLSNVYVVD